MIVEKDGIIELFSTSADVDDTDGFMVTACTVRGVPATDLAVHELRDVGMVWPAMVHTAALEIDRRGEAVTVRAIMRDLEGGGELAAMQPGARLAFKSFIVDVVTYRPVVESLAYHVRRIKRGAAFVRSKARALALFEALRDGHVDALDVDAAVGELMALRAAMGL